MALRTALLVAAGLVLAGTTTTSVAPATAAPEAGGQAPVVTTTDLPTGILWSDINDRGQIVGRTNDGNQVVIWHDGEVTPVAEGARNPANPDCPGPSVPPHPLCIPGGATAPLVNDRGQVALYQDDQAVLWRNGRFTDLGGGADRSWYLDLTDRGEVLVRRYFGQREVLGLWSRGTFHEIGSGPAGELRLRVPRMSAAGHVTVNVFDPACACASGLLWYRARRTELGDFVGHVNSRGQVASIEQDPATGERYLQLWQDGEVTRMPTLGGEQTYVQDINDRGQVVGTSTRPGSSAFRTVLWQDGEIIDISPGGPPATTGPYTRPLDINERGQVLIEAPSEATGWTTGFLWDDGELIELPAVDERLTFNHVEGFNERGQIFGRRFTGIGPTTPTLWQIRRPG